jgi:hypothetical protein
MDTSLVILIPLTAGCWLWLWFMVRRPERWNSIVEKENAFWVSRGVVSASLAERIKSFERGRGQKILVGTGAVLGTAALVFFLIWRLTR